MQGQTVSTICIGCVNTCVLQAHVAVNEVLNRRPTGSQRKTCILRKQGLIVVVEIDPVSVATKGMAFRGFVLKPELEFIVAAQHVFLVVVNISSPIMSGTL